MESPTPTTPPPSPAVMDAIPVPAVFIEGWRRRGLNELLPFQRAAIGAVFSPTVSEFAHWIIAAPAGAGKTLPAEAAMARHLAAGRGAVYLAPTRALAEARLAEFEDWLAPAGLRVLCATRERLGSDPAALAGRFDVLVAVPEKMNHYLLSHPAMLARIGIVVIDELQVLGDPERGGLLDLLLTKIRLSPYPAQMIALSAVLGPQQAGTLARWMDARLITDARRPRPLREGVLNLGTGLFRYRETGDGGTDGAGCGSGGDEGGELLASPDSLELLMGAAAGVIADLGGPEDPFAAALLAAAGCVVRRGGQALVFAPTRHASRLWARALAAMNLGLAPAREVLPLLGGVEPGLARDCARACLERGVAFHNGDLDGPMREAIEAGFNAGEIRVLVSTSTLGMGVNLAGSNVLQYPARIAAARTAAGIAGGGAGCPAGRPILAPLGRACFANQGGRAARLGIPDGPAGGGMGVPEKGKGGTAGRSMAVARCAAEAERFWNALIEAEPEPLEPPLAHAPLAGVALDLLAGGLARTEANLAGALGATASAALGGAPHAGGLAEALKECQGFGLIRQGAEGAFWRLTGLGEVAAALGLRPATAAALARFPRGRFVFEPEREEPPGPAGEPAGSPGVAPAPQFTEGAMFDLYLTAALTEDGRRAGGRLAAWGPRFDPARSVGAAAPRVRESPGGAADENAVTDGEAETEADGSAEAIPGGGSRAALTLLARPGGPDRAEWTALRAAAMLCDWTGGLATEEFEAKWGVFHAGFARVAGEFQWLLNAWAGIAEALGWPRAVAAGLRGLAARTGPGIPSGACGLARMGVRGLTRGAMHALAREGFDSPAALAAAPPGRLAELAGQDLAARLAAEARRLAPRAPRHAHPSGQVHPSDPTHPSDPSDSPHSPAAPHPHIPPVRSARPDRLIEITARQPGLVRLRGDEVRLPPLLFKLLAAVAEQPGRLLMREDLYLRLWPGGEGPEIQQLDSHRRRLNRMIGPRLHTARGGGGEVIEVVRGRGFRLTCAPGEVAFER